MSLAVVGMLGSSDWYDRVFGFVRVLIETEDRVTAVMLEHPSGIFLYLHYAPERLRGCDALPREPRWLSFRVADADLAVRDRQLTELGFEPSGPHQAHLGWALDVRDPDRTRLQLHTRQAISAEINQLRR